MPRVPGRESTKRKVKIEEVLIGSFVMPSEVWAWRRVCNIGDCDHRMGPRNDELATWKSCDESALPAFIAYDREGFPSAGMACPCHVAAIQDRA